MIALVDVFVGATPGVVDAHRVVRGDRSVQKGPLGLAPIDLAELLEGLRPLPKREHIALQSWEVYLWVNLVKRHAACILESARSRPRHKRTKHYNPLLRQRECAVGGTGFIRVARLVGCRPVCCGAVRAVVS